jgi:hypothetical protein
MPRWPMALRLCQQLASIRRSILGRFLTQLVRLHACNAHTIMYTDMLRAWPAVDSLWLPSRPEMTAMLKGLRYYIQDGNGDYPSGGIYW